MDYYVALADGFYSAKKNKGGGSYMIFKEKDFPEVIDVNYMRNLRERTPVHYNIKYNHTNCYSCNTAEAKTLKDTLSMMWGMGLLHPENYVLLLCDSKVVIDLLTDKASCRSVEINKIIDQINGIFKTYKVCYSLDIFNNLALVKIPGILQKIGPLQH